MNKPISNLAVLLQTLQPTLNEGVYAFTTVAVGTDIRALEPIAMFREAEGITLVIEEEAARRAHLPVLFSAAWITLTVHSDLHAVGLTAAVAAALAEADISCNVLAAAFHDHIFVPVASAHEAMRVLQQLQRRSIQTLAESEKSGSDPN